VASLQEASKLGNIHELPQTMKPVKQTNRKINLDKLQFSHDEPTPKENKRKVIPTYGCKGRRIG
jgi:hypothetical protein